MQQYKAPLSDIQFVLEHWLQAPEVWRAIPAYQDVDPELARQVVEQAGRFCSDVLAPLNASGDRQGCRLIDGQVHT